MTQFGKILMGVILITAVVLMIKGGSKKDTQTNQENSTSDNMTSEDQSSSDVEANVETSTETNNLFNGSMNDLIARGGDYKCTFDQTNDYSDSSGTVYISGKSIRGDFQSLEKVSNTNVESHMISDGEFSYVWSSVMPTGFKMKVVEDNSQDDSSAQTGQFDYNQKLNYDCQAWPVDQSQFSLPDGIQFTELPSQS